MMISSISNKFNFLLRAINLKENNLLITDKELLHQWQRVLRLKNNQKLIILNGNGGKRVFKIKSLTKDFSEIEASSDLYFQSKSTPEIYLYLSLLKKDNFEIALQKAVELGIDGFCPVIYERTIKMSYSLTRVKKIIKESVEQSGGWYLPEILPEIVDFKNFLKIKNNDEKIVIFDLKGINFEPSKIIKHKRVNIFIGPEGGFSKNELELIKELNLTLFNLGINRTLRAETAAIVASYLFSGNNFI